LDDLIALLLIFVILTQLLISEFIQGCRCGLLRFFGLLLDDLVADLDELDRWALQGGKALTLHILGSFGVLR
jgi:hypothetical protein